MHTRFCNLCFLQICLSSPSSDYSQQLCVENIYLNFNFNLGCVFKDFVFQSLLTNRLHTLTVEMMMMSSPRNLRSPFTASQWQELEHQALIFKYMVSGVPIPPDLIYNVKRSLEPSGLFPQQPIGWGCFQMGFSRKVDPEPGRCRRTDGKKWRCSKEAYPDSKYCERHMHRGRNRSRKPVETHNPNTSSPRTSAQSLNTTNNSFFINSRPPSFPQNSNTPNLFLSSGSSSSQADHKDYRYAHGMMRDEQALFPEASGTVRSLLPAADSYTNYKSFSQTQFQNITTDKPKQQQKDDEQHCFVLGTDFKSATSLRAVKLEKESENQKPLHHFFGDWTPKSTDSWLDLASNSGLD